MALIFLCSLRSGFKYGGCSVAKTPKSFHPLLKMGDSWACSKCTFRNPPTQKFACQICLFPSSPSPSPPPSSFRWSCRACTFANPLGIRACEVCGSRSPTILDLDLDLGDEPLDPSIGSVFRPLQRCTTSKHERGPDDHEDGFADPRSDKMKRARKEEVPLVAAEDGGPSSKSNMLKIMSYNVWFREDLEVYKRMNALGDLIQLHEPNIICFQEVTPSIYEIFRESSWWKAYTCSIPQEMASERAYFCMQMSRFPVKASFGCKPFANSIMGRELCTAEVDAGIIGRKLVIGTSHLESPCPAPPRWDQMYSSERVAQAKESLGLLLEKGSNAILCGDMNWDDKLDGTFPLPEGWVDAWSELRPGQDGWTYDTKANQMLSANRKLQKRLDRFACGLRDFRICSIEMIGTEPIPGLSYCKEKKVRNAVQKLLLPVLPSDHYGLLLTISGAS